MICSFGSRLCFSVFQTYLEISVYMYYIYFPLLAPNGDVTAALRAEAAVSALN